MSLHAPMDHLPLFGQPPEKPKAHRQAWYDLIRPRIREQYRGERITTDNVWALIEGNPQDRTPGKYE